VKSKIKTYQGSSEVLWDESFKEQIAQDAYNTAPVESMVRSVSHFLRARFKSSEQFKHLKFLEVGCGAGANLIWLAEKGIEPSGVDISKTALSLCRKRFEKKFLENQLGDLKHSSATALPFDTATFDGVIESCVFQHLNQSDRIKAHKEVVRIMKRGGIFIGHMLSINHSTYKTNKGYFEEIEPGTLVLASKTASSKINLESIGLSHFFSKSEYDTLLEGCSSIEPCEITYELPSEEAARRGYKRYCQAMWNVYAIK
jgi:ubiquinone/menaquinone biosynthesis C-methylase UbiE